MPLAPALAYAETGLWFTEEVPGLSPELRLPYPSIARLTELDAAHGDEIVLQSSASPITLVAKHRMVRDERFKLIYAPSRAGVKYMLFDTEQDPGERVDVAKDHPVELARLRGELVAWMLRDTSMTMKGGFLVPADVGSVVASDPPGAPRVRLGGTE